MSPRAMTTADPKLTKERLTIAATIGFRHAIMAATMNEQLHATTMTPMVIVTTVMDISFTVCGSGMAPPYAYNDCNWLRHRALATGSPYWWSRYHDCAY
jgi:hypothetical protein